VLRPTPRRGVLTARMKGRVIVVVGQQAQVGEVMSLISAFSKKDCPPDKQIGDALVAQELLEARAWKLPR
jgi:hypothetical protein